MDEPYRVLTQRDITEVRALQRLSIAIPKKVVLTTA